MTGRQMVCLSVITGNGVSDDMFFSTLAKTCVEYTSSLYFLSTISHSVTIGQIIVIGQDWRSFVNAVML